MHIDPRVQVRRASPVIALLSALLTPPAIAQTQPVKADASQAVTDDHGKYLDKNGIPTYRVAADGTVDFYTYAGYVRYTANCLQCHGPDGMGSSYAPALTHSLQTLSYNDFLTVVAGGKKDVNAAETLVMPALGTNKNVMCYIDAIYVYLRARADHAVGRGRPAKHQPKPHDFATAEDACMG